MVKSELLEILMGLREVYLSESQIVKQCGKSVNYNAATIKKLLAQLVESGDVIITERHKFAVTQKTNIVRGKFIAHPKGFGFVESEDKSIKDLFIPERRVNGAVHGDVVLAKKSMPERGKFFRAKRDGDSDEGEIIRIIKRTITQVVGVFSIVGGGGVVVPDDRRITDQIFIPIDKTMGARTNNKVVVKMIAFPSRNQMAIGEITEVLGDINDLGVDTLSIVRSYGLTEVFPEEVKTEAKQVAVEPTEEDLKNRRDFRSELTITIDGEDARDFDDAISLTKDKSDYILKVHIADVSHYVKQNGAIDKEAFNRATSVYFPDMVLPMLPEELSNNICSLNPNVDRLTLSVIMRFDERGNIKDYEIVNGVINSNYRMTYTKVAKMFDGDKALIKEYKAIAPMLDDMKTLAQALMARRHDKGELDFDLPEVQIVMDEKNKIKEIVKKPRTMADRLIEQFMVVTNEVVARHMKNMEMPFVYRVHETPSAEKIHTFNDFVKGIGLNLSIPEEEPKPRDVQKVLTAVKGRPMQIVINSLLLRSMQKAKYYERPLGHFGLALSDYCHFTSPIRRYPDLTIHRIIKLVIEGKMNSKNFDFYENFVVDSAVQSSERERLADEAERAVDDLKKCEYMSKKIGEVYTGFISGVTENGFFVQLENTIEGYVSIDSLPEDHYYGDTTKMAIIGKNHKYRLGQTVEIKVFRTDLVERKIDFVTTDSPLLTQEDE